MTMVSEIKVLRSAAGYYLGTTLEGQPYSRVTSYFETREEAAQELLFLNAVQEIDPWWMAQSELASGYSFDPDVEIPF
jgi:hypothetical protein